MSSSFPLSLLSWCFLKCMIYLIPMAFTFAKDPVDTCLNKDIIEFFFFVVHFYQCELIHLCFILADLSSFNSCPSRVLTTNFVFKHRHWADFITLLKIQQPNVPTSNKTVIESCNGSCTKPTRPGEKLSTIFPRFWEGRGRKGRSEPCETGPAAMPCSCVNSTS